MPNHDFFGMSLSSLMWSFGGATGLFLLLGLVTGRYREADGALWGLILLFCAAWLLGLAYVLGS